MLPSERPYGCEGIALNGAVTLPTAPVEASRTITRTSLAMPVRGSTRR